MGYRMGYRNGAPMARLAWTYSTWLGRRPSSGVDEHFRHTVVLPVPWAHTIDGDGEPLHHALVLAARPWWLCRDAFHASYRRWARWERALNRAVRDVPVDDDDAWDRAYDRYLAVAGPNPRSS